MKYIGDSKNKISIYFDTFSWSLYKFTWYIGMFFVFFSLCIYFLYVRMYVYTYRSINTFCFGFWLIFPTNWSFLQTNWTQFQSLPNVFIIDRFVLNLLKLFFKNSSRLFCLLHPIFLSRTLWHRHRPPALTQQRGVSRSFSRFFPPNPFSIPLHDILKAVKGAIDASNNKTTW